MELKTGFKSELSWKIFLDRYTTKDPLRQFQVGDLVIALVEPHPKWPKKDVGVVKALLDNDYLSIGLITGPQKGDIIERRQNECDRPLETTIHDVARRIASGVASVEKSPVRSDVQESFAREIAALRFVPGGRIWAGAGTGQDLTYFNCYVIPCPQDSRQGIVDTLGQMIEIMSRGGGVGINISSLRPQRAIVRGVNGRSSGAVSWMDLFSRATGLVEQGGCFAEDTRIATNQGLISAGELSSRIRTGEQFSALTHEGWRPITAQFHNGKKQLWSITTRRGMVVEVTEDHKMGVMRDGRVATVPLKALKVGDETLGLIGRGVPDHDVELTSLDSNRVSFERGNSPREFPSVLDERLAYLVGYMAGDGSGRRSDQGTVAIGVDDDYPSIANRLTDFSQALFMASPRREFSDGERQILVIDSPHLVEWLARNNLLEQKSDSIGVPERILQSGTTVMAGFIAGFFDAAGSAPDPSRGYEAKAFNRPIAQRIQEMLFVLGIAAHIYEGDSMGPDQYRLVVEPEFEEQFQGIMHRSVRVSECMGVANQPSYVQASRTVPRDIEPWGVGTGQRVKVDGSLSGRHSVEESGEGDPRAIAVVDRGGEVLADVIVSILPTRMAEVYDFEVADTHMVSGNGFYTSNSRRGALMLQIEDWHPDVWRFIEVKKTPGMVENANISVRISDRFMQAVKADADWDLVFPDTADPDYDEIWDGNLETWREREKPVIHYETVKAKKLWHAIIEGAWQAAEPGIVFDERHEKDSNSWYFNPLISTNPCVTGDTLVATDMGPVRARNLKVGMKIRTPEGLQPIDQVYNNGVQKIYRVHFSDGGFLDCTNDHRVKVARTTHDEWVMAQDLTPGDRVWVIPNEAFGDHRIFSKEAQRYVKSCPLNLSGSYDRMAGFLAGSVWGDKLTALNQNSQDEPTHQIRFGSDDQNWLDTFLKILQESGIPSRLSVEDHELSLGATVVVQQKVTGESETLGTILAKIGMPVNVASGHKALPDEFLQAPCDFVAGLLDGLFSRDGRVAMTDDGAWLQLQAISYELAQQVRNLLLQFGIRARVCRGEAIGSLDMAAIGELYDVVVTNEGIGRFREVIGLTHPEKSRSLGEFATDSPASANSWTAAVTGVEDTGREEEVFDVHEPKTLTWVTNGYVSFDCAEQPLPAWGVCTLGHVNLAAFYNEERGDVDWDALRVTIRMGTRFLDDIVDATPYFFDENYRNQQKERRIGLGTMGLGELLIRLGLRYGSSESIEFIDRLYEFICTEAYLYDVELAKEKGAFPAFDAEQYLQSGFMQRMPDSVREAIRANGTRNVTILTQAPTGTVGSMVNTSTGIEPFYALTYFRQSRLGFDEQYVQVAQEWMDANPGGTLPEYFVGAMDLTPEEHVRVQATIQRWTDSSISKTANAPSTYTLEDTASLYELAYDLGCKGVTIYRDQSRQEQVLHLSDTSKAAEAPAATIDTGVDVEVYPLPAQVNGRTYRKETPAGTARVVINEVDGSPFEVFMLLGRAGSEVQSFMEALGRIISLYLRSNGNLTARRRLELAADQLKGIGGANQMGFGAGRVLSVVDGIGKLLDSHLNQGKGRDNSAAEPQFVKTGMSRPGTTPTYDLCPQCDAPSLIYEEGCQHCTVCGYSKC